MQHLPISQTDGTCLLPSQVPIAYLSPLAILQSRDIDKTDFWAPPEESELYEDNALPTVLLRERRSFARAEHCRQ